MKVSKKNADLIWINTLLLRTAEAFANLQVIQNTVRASVTLSNQKEYEAKVVGSDPKNDIAVLRVNVEPGEIQKLQLGTSHDLLVGQKVFAIGNPFGLDQTLTAGIVSSLGRQVQGVTGRFIRDVIQTDCAINPGNSGGPLLDSQGRLVGMNTMIYSPSGACEIVYSQFRFLLLLLSSTLLQPAADMLHRILFDFCFFFALYWTWNQVICCPRVVSTQQCLGVLHSPSQDMFS